MSAVGDLYFSVDIEADGPIPGPYSMLSFGLALAGSFDGGRFRALDPKANSFYTELAPISDRYDPAALAVSDLDRERLIREGRGPADAMADAAGWVRETAGDQHPVLVGFPLAFDWMFIYWYFVRFTGASPFDFSSALDIKTMFQQKAAVTVSDAGKDDLPAFLRGSTGHTHQSRDDAIEQGEIFARIFTWNGRTPAQP
jgi:hypothetical protein